MTDIRRLHDRPQRSHTLPWWSTETLINHQVKADAEAPYLAARDDLFVDERDVLAHLVFAMAQAGFGARVNLQRLDMVFDQTLEQDRAQTVEMPGLQVYYVDPALGVAVVTDDSGTTVTTIRFDTVLHIEVTSDCAPRPRPISSVGTGA